MKKILGNSVMALLMVFACATDLLAQAPPAQPQTQQARPPQGEGRGAAAAAGAEAPPREEWSVTEGTARVGAQSIPYKASAGTTLLKNDASEPIGLMYSVAYTRSDVKDLSTRPVSFFYNGGPGSSTMWLHMGSFGPKRIQTVNGEFTPPRAVQDRGQRGNAAGQNRHRVHRRHGHGLQPRGRQGHGP